MHKYLTCWVRELTPTMPQTKSQTSLGLHFPLYQSISDREGNAGQDSIDISAR